MDMWSALRYGAHDDDDEFSGFSDEEFPEPPPDYDDGLVEEFPPPEVDGEPQNSRRAAVEDSRRAEVDGGSKRSGVEADSPSTKRARNSGGGNSQDSGENSRKLKSQATTLVEMALDQYELHVSTEGVPFATPRSGPRVAFPLRGGPRSLRAELAAQFFRAHGTPPSAQSLADAAQVLEGMAAETAPVQWSLRVAEFDGAHWLDLGDSTGRCVRVGGGEWRVVDGPPDGLFFRRSRATLPLPTPAERGGLDALWGLIPIDPQDRPLLLAWLIAALRPNVAHPLLILSGEAGAGKTTAARIVAGLLDPSAAGVRAMPADPADWHVAMAASWIATFDNATVLSGWQVDALCRAVTGDAMIKRRLYTDDDVVAIAYRRPVIITSVDLGAMRGDLADRTLLLPLRRIPEDRRRGDEDVDAEWRTHQPVILAGLLDLAAAALDIAGSINPGWSPRMTDFWRVLLAVDGVLGTDGARRYVERARSVVADTVAADPVAAAIIERLPGGFVGSARELLEAITPSDDHWRPPKGWPSTPRSLTVRLRNVAPALRAVGWQITDDVDGHDKITRWTITPPVAGQDGQAAGQAEPLTRKDPNTKPQVRGPIAGQAGQAEKIPYLPLAATSGDDGLKVGQREQVALTRVTRTQSTAPTCTVCGKRIDPALADLGWSAHPDCEGW